MLSRLPHSWSETSHLAGTWWPPSCYCLDTVSVDVSPSAGALSHLWKPSLAFHNGEFPRLRFLFDSVLFMSAPVEEMAVPPRFLSVYMTSPGWQQSSNFGMYLQRGKTHQDSKKNARRHIWAEYKGKARGEGRKESQTEKTHRRVSVKVKVKGQRCKLKSEGGIINN